MYLEKIDFYKRTLVCLRPFEEAIREEKSTNGRVLEDVKPFTEMRWPA